MLKNKIVEVRRWEIFTTSKIVADKLEVPHKRFLVTLEKIIKRQKSRGKMNTPTFEQKYIETVFENRQKAKYKWFLINEPAFSKLIMNLWQYKKADVIQDEFIEAFFKMKEALQNQSNNSWIEARKDWKTLRKEETDILKQLTEYAEQEIWKPVTYPLYSTYTRMTNKHLQFIVDCKDWKPIRDLVSVRDLWFIWIVDDRCKNAMIDWMNRKLPYKEIYKYCKEEVSWLVESLDFKPKLWITNIK